MFDLFQEKCTSNMGVMVSSLVLVVLWLRVVWDQYLVVVFAGYGFGV